MSSISDLTRLQAIYYPFSMCLNEQALKRLLLLFDTVYFIHPNASGYAMAEFNLQMINIVGYFGREPVLLTDETDPLLRFREEDNFERWKETFAYLEQEGAVAAIDPANIVESQDQLLARSTEADIRDGNFVADILSGINQDFALEGGKNRGAGFIQTDYKYMRFGWQLGWRGIPPSLKRDWFENRDVIVPKRDSARKRPWSKREAELREREAGSPLYFKPKYAGALALNRALIASTQLALPLVTDNPYYQSAITRKMERILALLSDDTRRSAAHHQLSIDRGTAPLEQETLVEVLAFVESLMSSSTFRRTESHRLISDVLVQIIDDHALQQLSYEDILDYKARTIEERERFIVAVHEWAIAADQLLAENKGNSTQTSRDIYLTKVLPEVQKYQDSLSKVRRGLFSRLAGNTAEGIGVSLTATTITSLLGGLTIPQMLVLSTAVAAPLIGKSVKEILDYKVQRSDKQMESRLTYLVGLA